MSEINKNKINELINELNILLSNDDNDINNEILKKKHKVFEELIIAYIRQMNEESLTKVKKLSDIYANTQKESDEIKHNIEQIKNLASKI